MALPGGKTWVTMRGTDHQHDKLFSYVRPDSRVPADHPLRTIRRVTDSALTALSPKFAVLYSAIGRPSISPEKLLRALLLQAFYSIRSERQLMEQLNYNLLFRWFVGLPVDEPVWVPTVFSHNRDRLLAGNVAAEFLVAVLNLPEVRGLLSAEHFSVDGTLTQAWASMKSFVVRMAMTRTPGPAGTARGIFTTTGAPTRRMPQPLIRMRGWQRSPRATRQKLAFVGHLLMDYRNGLLVDARLTHATGTAECEAALDMLGHLPAAPHATVGADKAYDTARFVSTARDLGVTPHVGQNITAHRGSNIDGRTTRHDGYRLSQSIRKQIEEANGWIKEVAGLAQTKHRGLARVGWMFTLEAAAYNLVRLPKLLPTG